MFPVGDTTATARSPTGTRALLTDSAAKAKALKDSDMFMAQLLLPWEAEADDDVAATIKIRAPASLDLDVAGRLPGQTGP